jgi:general secretion pathway protein F
MPLFRYKALATDGAVLTGELESISVAAASEHLQSLGHFPIVTTEARRIGLTAWLNRDFTAHRRPSPNDLAIAFHELATLLQAGLPLDRALDLLTDLTPSKPLRAALAAVSTRIRDGSGLADALAADEHSFPRLAISLVRAGELGGGLDTALARLADYLTKAHTLREAIRSALVYPVILLATAALSLVFVLIYVLPAFKPLFAEAGRALPLPTRLVMALGDAVAHWAWLGAALIGLAILAVRRALRDPEIRRRRDAALLRLPMFGALLLKTEAARFSRTLGTLIGNGVPLPSALGITAGTLDNRAIAAIIADTVETLREGEGLAAVLARARAFPSLSLQLVRVGEETGRLEEMLLRQAELYEREVQRGIDRLLAALVPALTILLGVVVAGLIGSILVAILKVNELAL